ncbi:hypothetical protein [Yinghuangia seranimata]|uniref:hypothetical protein n=1 Tax=Yinghuangia seranimata TaxID=408067 RepID=UPI00248BF74F|nr:hypothetical protein [Yinghuangia seranimata]MDI2129834.1 hypothetical protein [Yinghuangia seranimata]
MPKSGVDAPHTPVPLPSQRRDTVPPSGRPRLRWIGPTLVVGAVTGLITAHALLYRYWIVDDAAVTFAYARSIAEGHGIALQPGAPSVEAYSNSTWLVLLVLGRFVGLFDHGAIAGFPDYVLYPKLLAVLCCAGTVAAMYRTASYLVRRPAVVTLVAGTVLAAVPSYVIWCFSGLENSLYALLVAWIAAVLVGALANGELGPRAAVVCGLLACTAALTRPDGAIYAAAFPAVALLAPRLGLRSRLRSTLIATAAFALPYGAFLLWRHARWGLWVPNTAVAKAQGVPSPRDLGKVGELVGYAGWPAVLLGVGMVAVLLSRPSAVRGLVPGLLIPLGLALAGYAVLQPDWMAQWRFATPVWPLAALVVTVAASHVLGRGRRLFRVLAVAAVAGAVALSGTLFASAASDFRKDPTFPMCWVADRYGHEFNELADLAEVDGHATLLVPDMGGTALTSRLRLVDYAGLADAEIARYYRDRDMTGLRDYVFGTVRPTFIRVGGAWWAYGTGLARDPRLATDYEEIQRDSYDVGGRTYIRKGVVTDPQVLDRLRVEAAHETHRLMRVERRDPLRACGAVLRAGEGTASRLRRS